MQKKYHFFLQLTARRPDIGEISTNIRCSFLRSPYVAIRRQACWTTALSSGES